MALFCGDFLIENESDLKTYGCFLSKFQKDYAREYLKSKEEESMPKSITMKNSNRIREFINDFKNEV